MKHQPGCGSAVRCPRAGAGPAPHPLPPAAQRGEDVRRRVLGLPAAAAQDLGGEQLQQRQHDHGRHHGQPAAARPAQQVTDCADSAHFQLSSVCCQGPEEVHHQRQGVGDAAEGEGHRAEADELDAQGRVRAYRRVRGLRALHGRAVLRGHLRAEGGRGPCARVLREGGRQRDQELQPRADRPPRPR